ncbi:MAG TPA: glutamine-hydrolyzing GMP synthase [Terriglobales bacterium]|nr:glutamine-hydrolyzing GMP synthase [Terriglobales bacterium]
MPSIVVLDFGAQYSQLIARRIRELHVHSLILPFNASWPQIQAQNPAGIILSGGPSSVYAPEAPRCTPEVWTSGLPVLGICYGLQLMVDTLGGAVENAAEREFGRAAATVDAGSGLFKGSTGVENVWMSHGDSAQKLPPGFRVIGRTPTALAAIEDSERRFWAVQFHPEVHHTENGRALLANFLELCQVSRDWTPRSLIEDQVARIRHQVGEKGRAVCGLSGGVDSSVAATLVHRAIGDRLTCVFVNNGLLRKDEFVKVQRTMRDQLGLNLLAVDAGPQFLRALEGVTDPEQKRKIIGKVFIEVFEEAAAPLKADFLVQGTLYPDVIESVSVKGPSAVIKSHHNVGGLPAEMRLKLIEPLRELFKDEVRQVGADLDLSPELLQRQPFPGPGLAVRILGEITAEKIRLVQEADAITVEEIKRAGLYTRLWQSFAVLLPVRTVGVMGDLRTYGLTCAIRAVQSEDGMTADWAPLPYEVLATISNRIVNEVSGINRVVYDISSKPPSTIEWE